MRWPKCKRWCRGVGRKEGSKLVAVSSKFEPPGLEVRRRSKFEVKFEVEFEVRSEVRTEANSKRDRNYASTGT